MRPNSRGIAKFRTLLSKPEAPDTLRTSTIS